MCLESPSKLSTFPPSATSQVSSNNLDYASPRVIAPIPDPSPTPSLSNLTENNKPNICKFRNFPNNALWLASPSKHRHILNALPEHRRGFLLCAFRREIYDSSRDLKQPPNSRHIGRLATAYRPPNDNNDSAPGRIFRGRAFYSKRTYFI